MEFHKATRYSLIIMALFPALWGMLSVLNNISGFSGTVEYAIAPLIGMKDTYANPAQTWRAIDSTLVAQLSLVGITLGELLVGLFGILSLFKMVKTRHAPYTEFSKGKASLVMACTLGVLVWGVGFAVLAGDYFLAWQSKTTLATQIGGLIYAIPCFLILIFATVQKD